MNSSSVNHCLLGCLRKQISPEEGDIKSLCKMTKQGLCSARPSVYLLLKNNSAQCDYCQTLLTSQPWRYDFELLLCHVPTPLPQCSLLCVWFPDNSIWHLLDEPKRSESFLGFDLDSQTSRNFSSWQLFPSPGLWLIPRHKYERYINNLCIKYSSAYKDLIKHFFSVKIQCLCWELKTDWSSSNYFLTCFKEHGSSFLFITILSVFRVNDPFLKPFQPPFNCISIKTEDTGAHKHNIDKNSLTLSLLKEWRERRKSHLSAGRQNRLHFVLECWETIALDSKWKRDWHDMRLFNNPQ